MASRGFLRGVLAIMSGAGLWRRYWVTGSVPIMSSGAGPASAAGGFVRSGERVPGRVRRRSGTSRLPPPRDDAFGERQRHSIRWQFGFAHDPGARLHDIAASLGITERSAHGSTRAWLVRKLQFAMTQQPTIYSSNILLVFNCGYKMRAAPETG